MKTRTVILAGGEGSRLGVLTAKRTKPAVPFAGKYRIIDFPLSNCVNSGLYDVMLITQYRPHSLIEHIGAGGPWDLNRDFTGGIRILTPYTTRGRAGWFSGTADAIQQNYTFVMHDQPDIVLILSGDHIYKMDYEPFITFHLDHQADLTIATMRVPLQDASRFGVLSVDNSFRVTDFQEKPSNPTSSIISMGVYVFSASALDKMLYKDNANTSSSHDFGKDIIPMMLKENNRVFAYPYSGYWVDVGTIRSYWQAHMDLLKIPPSIDLYERGWVIHTRTEERPPVLQYTGAEVRSSMICDGVRINQNAFIQNSILSPGVVIGQDARISDSIILTDTIIGRGTKISHAIIDKRVFIGESAEIGTEHTQKEPGFVCIGKSSRISDGIKIESGVSIDPESVI